MRDPASGRHDRRTSFVPALRFPFLTRLYDPVIRLALREDRFRERLVEQVGAGPGHRVLDLGCGTGTLALALARRYPASQVIGLDLDQEILAIARDKATPAGVPVHLVRGLATRLPLGPSSLDRVVSSLVFHHLDGFQKRAALAEAIVALRPGGEFHLADWGKPADLLMRMAFLPVRVLDGFAVTADNASGRLVGFIEEAGFRSVEETGRMRTMFGVLTFHRAVRP